MKKIFILTFLFLNAFAYSKAQQVDVSKFIGIWHAEDSDWSPKAMKISQENGKISVHIKNFVKGEAILDGDCLELSTIDEENYGEYWIGSWGGWYDEDHEWVSKEYDHILVKNDDGSYGTNGKVSGFYDKTNGRRIRANKEISKVLVQIKYIHEGALELSWTIHSDYYKNDHLLFYQGSASNINNRTSYIYTNW